MELTGCPQNICHQSISARTGDYRFGGVETTFTRSPLRAAPPSGIFEGTCAGSTPRGRRFSFDQAADDKALKGRALQRIKVALAGSDGCHDAVAIDAGGARSAPISWLRRLQPRQRFA